MLLSETLECAAESSAGKTPSRIQNLSRRRAKLLTAAQISELVEAYKCGDSTYSLAQRFGIHRTTVTAHLERNGVGRR